MGVCAGLILAFGAGIAHAEDTPIAGTKRLAMTDGAITMAVERKFRHDRALPFDRMDVRTADGIVMIRGTVGSLLAKERAALQAQTVRGVRSVVNGLVVAPAPGMTDAAIRQSVKNALLTDPATDSYEVDVAVKEGEVTLTGTVDSWREYTLAATVAKGVHGVRDVTNEIGIARAMERPAREIAAEVEQALHWDVYIDDGLITVSADEAGTVTLSGVVGSAAERRLALAKAYTAGVKKVVGDDLVVRRWARDPDLRANKFMERPDAEIRAAVEKAMMHDPRVFSFHVDTDVDGGLVSLGGTVDNLSAKRAAGQDARNTVGIVGVLNLLKVKPKEVRSDADILADIQAALRRDPYLQDHEVGVKVTDGVAHLDGMTESWFERGQVDDLTSRVNGVRDIVNRIQVMDRPVAFNPYVDAWRMHDHGPVPPLTPLEPIADLALERRIELELLWSPFVNSALVDVDVSDGVATLTGTVGDWTESSFARGLAYEAGATLVHNKLQVNLAATAAQ